MNRILVLKELGFALEQIAPMLAESLSPEQFRATLAARRAEVEREHDLLSLRLRRLDRRIAELDQQAPREAVLFRHVPAATILTTRFTCASFDEARSFVAALLREVPRRLGRRHLGRMLAIQHAPEFEPDILDLEIGFQLEAERDDAAMTVDGRQLTLRELPALAQAAVCVRVGTPDQAHGHNRAIAERVEAEGLVLDGPNREVFLKPPSVTEPPVIEMQFPVRTQPEPRA